VYPFGPRILIPALRESPNHKENLRLPNVPLDPTNRPKNLHKFALLAVALFVLALAIGGTILALHWPFSQARVTQSLQGTFPATVTFQKFHSTYFPHPGCIGEGVAFEHLGRPSGTVPIATIQRLTIEARYADLFLRPGHLARILLEGFRISVPRIGTPLEQSGWKESKSTILIGELVANGATLEIGRAGGRPPLLFDIHNLKLSSVGQSNSMAYDVAMHNPVPPGEIRSQGHFGPWNSGDPGQTPIDGHYIFQRANLGVFSGIAGILSSEDKFHGFLGHIESQGSIDIPDFMVTRSKHSIHLTAQFHLFVNGTNGDVQLERVSAGFLNTHVQASGQVAGHAGQHGKTTSVDFSVQNGHVNDVLWMFVRGQKPSLVGTTSFHAHVTIPPEKRPFVQKLRLVGDFGIDNGQFTKTSTQDHIDTLSEKSRGTKPDAVSAESDPERVISNLAGHVELRNATANFENLSFQVPGAFAQLHGTYNLETQALGLHGTLKTDAELSNMTGGVKSVLIKPFNVFFKRRHAGAVVPVHLLGTYSQPQAGLDLPVK
jgi:hypothetical protein